ncbi:hypothetical protein BGX23_000585 [Mortierella sp. AD031]|nr:hypothetical protein BGX23_000585 [Mortierella sp. AD031]
MVVAPISFPNISQFFSFRVLESILSGDTCFQQASKVQTTLFQTWPKDGVISLPRTDVTRCQYGSDKLLAMSETYIKFAVGHVDDYDKVATSIFDDHTNLTLLQYMRVAIDNKAFSNPTNNSTIVIFTRISTDVEFFACVSSYLNVPNDMGLTCTYLATAMIITKPQAWDPIMTTNPKRDRVPSVSPNSIINQISLTVYHLPSESTSPTTTFSAAHLLKATTGATGYLSSLGHNVFLNKSQSSESETLYILFDAVELKDAIEIPTSVLVVSLVLAVVCGIVWAVSELMYTVVFNGSLYKVIFKELEPRGEKPIPMLMYCTQDPLFLEDNELLPDEGSIPSSQDIPLQQLGNGSTPSLTQPSTPSPVQPPLQAADQPPTRLSTLPSMQPPTETVFVPNLPSSSDDDLPILPTNTTTASETETMHHLTQGGVPGTTSPTLSRPSGYKRGFSPLSAV